MKISKLLYKFFNFLAQRYSKNVQKVGSKKMVNRKKLNLQRKLEGYVFDFLNSLSNSRKRDWTEILFQRYDWTDNSAAPEEIAHFYIK